MRFLRRPAQLETGRIEAFSDDPRLAPPFVRFLSLQYAGSAGAFAGIVLLALLNAVLGLVLAVLIMLAYALPPRAPEYREDVVA